MFDKILIKIKKFWKWGIGLLIPIAFAAPFFFNEPLGEISFQPIEREDLTNWNIKSVEQIDNNKFIADFRIKQVRFLDIDDKFKPIDTSFVLTPEGYCTDKLLFKLCLPLRSQGIAKMDNNNRFHTPTQTKITEPVLSLTSQAENVVDVAGVPTTIKGDNYIVYPNAYPTLGADLLLGINWGRTTRFSEIVRFNNPAQIPVSDFTLSFLKEFDKPTKISRKINGIKTAWEKNPDLINNQGISIALGDSVKRGISFKKFYIWDSNGKKEEITVILRSLGQEKYRLIKQIPVSFFQDAIFPVYTDAILTAYPDPNPETNTVDGRTSRVIDGNWSSMQNGNGTAFTDDTDGVGVLYQAEDGTNWNQLQRGYFLFDTSAIGAGGTVSSSTFSVGCVAGGGQNHSPTQYAELVHSTTTSNTSLAASDYEGTRGNTQLQSSTQWTILQLCATVNVYNHYVLNADGRNNISLTSITKLGLRITGDRTNTEPTKATLADSLQANLAEGAGTSIDPRLLVDYTVASADANLYESGSFFQLLRNYIIQKVYARTN